MLSRPSPVAPLPPPAVPSRRALKACAHPRRPSWCLVQICEVYLPTCYGPHMSERQGRGEGWVGVGAWGRQPPVLMGVAAGGCAAGR